MAPKVTIKTVAAQAGVSEATVSRALNDSPQVKPATRRRIRQLAQDLGYHPNGLARSIRTQRTNTLGVIIPDILNNFFTKISRAIEDTAAQAGYNVLLVNTDEHLDREADAVDLMLEKQAAGIIIASAGDATDYATRLGTTPAVFVDRMPPAQLVPHFDCILVDNIRGTQELVSEMLAQGAQRIGILNSAVSTTATERLTGYHQALKRAGIAFDPAIEVAARSDNSNVAQMTRQLLVNQQCDGLLAADNTIANGVLRKLPDLHLHGVHLGSFDDQDWFDFLPQPIVTAKQPIAAIGQTAVERLIARINEPTLAPEEFRLTAQIITHRLTADQVQTD